MSNHDVESKILFSSKDSFGGILKCLPHRYPFLLIDRILSIIPEKEITVLKNVTYNEFFFQGHFPGYPVMPGVLIVEAMAQASGVLALNQVREPESYRVYFTSIQEVKFRKPVVPGDSMILHVSVLQKRGTTSRFEGKAMVEDKIVCEGLFTAMIVKKENGSD